MGLFDFFEDIKDKVSDLAFDASIAVDNVMCEVENKVELAVDSVKEFSEIISEGKQDLEDITVSGAGSLFSNEVPKCASEIRSEAEKIISKSNHEYEKKHKYVQEKLQGLEDERWRLYTEKKKIACLMNMSHHCSICIPTEIPALQVGKPKTVETDHVFMELFFIPNTPPIFKSMLAYSRASKRLEDAREYLEKAKDYEIEIAKESGKLKELECFIEKVISIFAEEREVLKILKESLSMDRAEKSRDAVRSLEILLAESVLDKDGRTNKKYEAAIRGIKEKLIMG